MKDAQLTICNHLTRVLRSHGTVTAVSKSEIAFVAKTGLAVNVLFNDNGPVILKRGEEAFPYPITSTSETAATILKSIGLMMK